MLTQVQAMIDELSSFLQNFSENNSILPLCILKSCPQLSLNVDNKCTNNQYHAINWELKSTEKQPFDIRLSFNSVQLKDWWPHLDQLCRQFECFDWKHCHVATALVVDKIHSIDIRLSRKKIIDRLLSSLCQQTSQSSHKAVVIRINSSNHEKVNFFASKRITLACNFVENLFNHFGTSTVRSADFNKFSVNFDDSNIDWKQLFDEHKDVLSTDQRISSNDLNSPNLKKILHYLCVISHYLTHLGNTSESPVAVVMIVAESEFTRLQVVTDLLRSLPDMQGQFTFKLVKAAGVSFDERTQVDSFASYKELLSKESIIDDISPDNLDILVETLLAFSLLTLKLNSQISKLVHFRNESIFVQYNIARIKSILDKFDREYSSQNFPDQVNFSLLTSDHEWSILFVHLLRMQHLTQWIFRQLIDESTDRNCFCELDCNKMLDLIKKLAHSFSCYYRNVKILAEPVDHLLPTIAARVKFCDLILKQMCFYFLLLDIGTADRM